MANKSNNWFSKHKILTTLIALVLLLSIGSAGSDKKSATDVANDMVDTTKTDTKEQVAKIGTPVRDGKFEFTAKAIECDKPSVGTNEYLTKVAQGQYCLLSITVKNIGNEKQSLFSFNQKLLKDKFEYSADDTATIYVAPQGNSWFSDINPGNSVEGTIVFDVPKDVTPTLAEFHDSAFSSGVTVSLQ